MYEHENEHNTKFDSSTKVQECEIDFNPVGKDEFQLKELDYAISSDGNGQHYFGFLSPRVRSKNIVLSIHPEYVEKILNGEKTVELRRRFPNSLPTDSKAFIYSTAPIFAIVGSTIVGSVNILPIKQIWLKFNSKAQVSRPKFEEYFKGLGTGYAIEMKKPQKFAKPLPLNSLREKVAFTPPQSFQYVNEKLGRILENETQISN